MEQLGCTGTRAFVECCSRRSRNAVPGLERAEWNKKWDAKMLVKPTPVLQKQPETDADRDLAARNVVRLQKVESMLARCERWHAMIVPPQKEVLIEKIMDRLGFDVFVPVEFRYRRVNSRQKVKKYVPYVMASRYVFAGFGPESTPWYNLLRMQLFSGVVSFDGAPVTISPFEMRRLFVKSGEMEARASAVRLNRSIVTGDRVVVTEGALCGQQFTIDEIVKGLTAKGQIRMFGRDMPVEVSLTALDPA